MNNSVKTNTDTLTQKKKDTKTAIRFFVTLALCSFIGGLFGVLIGNFTKDESLIININNSWRDFQISLANIAPIILISFNILGFVISILLFYSLKKYMRKLDIENDEMIEKSEFLFNRNTIILSIFTILNMMLFSLMIYQASTFKYQDSNRHLNILFMISTFVFIIFSIFNVILLQASMKQIRSINPEKTVSTLDFKFQEKFINECDEAERLLIYKASYKAFKNVNISTLIGMLICGLVSFVIDISIVPTICLAIISLILNISYAIEASKKPSRSL